MADGGGDDEPIYLHGDLDLTIIEARRLPNMDMASERLRRCFTCQTFKPSSHPKGDADAKPALGGKDSAKKKLQLHAKGIHSDPYVTVNVPGSTVVRTHVIGNSKNPRWNEHFNVPLAHPVVNLEFLVKDNDVFGAQLIGSVLVPARRIVSGELIDEAFPVMNSSGKLQERKTELYIKMKFTPCEENPLYRHGIAGDPQHLGVRHTYFPLRKGGSVRLYQDAHVPDDMLPKIELDGGAFFEHQQCWEDICHAISEAHHMIYIAGWSVYHKIKLVREPTRPLPRGGDLTLGELLKYKSQEGVRVLLLVWDDKTSHDKLFIRTEGVMATHDEELKKFFKHSSVNCVLAPRYGSSKLGFIKQQIVGGIFTHHQKCVIVDTQASGNNRKITSFIGGLDLCDGRYDTPKHRLFQDLDTVYQGDFHNPTYAAGLKAPREPWHDLHSRLEGPAAYDVLVNFQQRWVKATRWKEFRLRIKSKEIWHDDSLIKIERISWIISPPIPAKKDDKITFIPKEEPSVWVSREDDPETWHVQVFRSIDSGSLRGFPKDVDTAKSMNLDCSKNMVIDKSIQTAYIQAIRSAQHFIYIENQYFLGSSYAWPSYKDAGADHLIPMELALKIVSKIRAKERFAVYVVIPMWPEGDPKTATVQEILFWQSQTMEMMYQLVARELNAAELKEFHPLDYLNFYCLGNREEIPQKMLAEIDPNAPNGGNKVTDSFKFQRFMIYVHAKGMIVDDEYVIIGSANINQRSMAGTKDTEIAMGSYQPHHTWTAKKRHPHGQIYGYRKSLWAEHLGMLSEIFEKPESVECVRKVNEISIDNWKKFADESFSNLQGHLLKYPVEVTAEGKVCPLPGHENFLDAGGSVIGAYSVKLPDVLTT
ncbi:hypothetical protein QQ045_010642 [Rhodiola kirilowii]